MECPQCSLKQPAGRNDCVRCGAVFHTLPVISHEISRIDRAGFTSVVIGSSFGLFVALSPIGFFLSPILTIVHELGHAVFGWLFGYPSIPAFDFVYGGGVTINTDRQYGLLLLIYLIFGAVIYKFRKNRSIVTISILLVLLHLLCSFTSLHNLLCVSMGHGFELLFASIFLYRAISGSSLVYKLEQPLYGFVGSYIVFHNVKFAYQLLTSSAFRIEYEEAKGGGHWMDFSRIADDYMGGKLLIVALLFLVSSLLVPLVTFLSYRYHKHLANIFSDVYQA